MATGGKKPGEPLIQSQATKKSEYVKELRQLRIQEQNFEKEKQTHLYTKHGSLHAEMADLQSQEQKARMQLNAEKLKLKQQLNKIKNMVKKFQRELKDVKPTDEFIQRLRIIMEDIEEHMSSFKENQKEQYDELMREERLTTQEVDTLNKKFDMWATLGPVKIASSTKGKKTENLASQRDITKDLPPQVAAFERFQAQNGGVRGGWDEYDHGTFLKYRNRHKAKLTTFVRELLAYLPTRTEEEIRQHEFWYQQYLDLNEEKKEAIQRWKDKRDIEKESMLRKAADADSDEENEKKKQQLKEILEQERLENKARLNKWKVEKELERAEEEERKLRQQIEKSRKEEEDRRIHEEQRVKVEEYRRQRAEEKEQRDYMKSLQAQLEKEKRLIATNEVQKLQERDLNQVKKKVAKNKAKQESEKERQTRLQAKIKAHNEAHIRRDPSRLLQSTAGTRHRQMDRERSGGQIFHTQPRAVPSWRQT